MTHNKPEVGRAPQEPQPALASGPAAKQRPPADAADRQLHQLPQLQRQQLEPEARSERNLDSGYAWVILIVMFLLNSTTNGMTRVYGLVYAKQVSIGYYSHEQASWPIATASTVENLTGLLTPALARYLTWRQIELLSTALFILSNLLAYFSRQLWLDILSLGIIQGVALSMCTIMALAINNDYFERYRTTAYGISMSGSTCAIFYLGPAVSLMLAKFDLFRTVYLAIAIIICLNLALVMFIVPRKKQRLQEGVSRLACKAAAGPHKLQHSIRHRISSRIQHTIERQDSLTSIHVRCVAHRQSAIGQWASPAVAGQKRSHGERLSSSSQEPPGWPPEPQAEARTGLAAAAAGAAPSVALVAGLADAKRHQSLRVAPLARAPKRLAKSVSCYQVTRANNAGTSYGATQASSDASPPLAYAAGPRFKLGASSSINSELNAAPDAALGSCPPCSGSAAQVGAAATAFAAAKAVQLQHQLQQQQQQLGADKSDPKEQVTRGAASTLCDKLLCPYLHCVWIMLAIYYLVARIYILILADFSHDHGLSLDESSWLLNYWSIGELIGRILLGSFIDMRWLSIKNNIVLTCSALAASIALMVAFENIYVYAACCATTAALVSLEYMLINVLIIDYIGREHVTSTYAIASLITSPVLFVRPLMIGFFRDRLNSYDGLLLTLAGVCLTFALLFAALEPLVVRVCRKPAR